MLRCLCSTKYLSTCLWILVVFPFSTHSPLLNHQTPFLLEKKEIIFSLVGIERGLELLEKGVCGAALILIITGIGGAQQSLDRWSLCVCVCVCAVCMLVGGTWKFMWKVSSSLGMLILSPSRFRQRQP